MPDTQVRLEGAGMEWLVEVTWDGDADDQGSFIEIQDLWIVGSRFYFEQGTRGSGKMIDLGTVDVISPQLTTASPAPAGARSYRRPGSPLRTCSRAGCSIAAASRPSTASASTRRSAWCSRSLCRRSASSPSSASC